MRSRPTLPALAAFLAFGLPAAPAFAGGCGCGGGGTYTTTGPGQAVATQGYFVSGGPAPAAAPAPVASAGYGYEQAQYAPALGMASPSSYPGYAANPGYAAPRYQTYSRGYGRLFRMR